MILSLILIWISNFCILDKDGKLNQTFQTTNKSTIRQIVTFGSIIQGVSVESVSVESVSVESVSVESDNALKTFI